MNGLYQPYWSDGASDELEHHGILGMKWGIRRYQNKDGSLTVAGKKRYKTSSNKISKKKLKSGMYTRSDSDDITFPKGTKLYRMTYSNSDPAKGLYVTRNKMDRDYYKNSYSDSLMGLGEDPKELKENTYTTNDELKIPSWDKRKAAFEEVANNKKIRSEIIEDMATQYIKRSAMIKVSSIKDAKDYIKEGNVDLYEKKYIKKIIGESSEYGKTKIEELDKQNPLTKAKIMSQIISASEKARNAYINILKSQGYNATVDDFGRKGLWGAQGDTSESLIIFDPSVLTKKSSKRVSSDQYLKSVMKTRLNSYKYDANVLNDATSKELYRVYKNVIIRNKLPATVVKNLYSKVSAQDASTIAKLEAERQKKYMKL